MHSITQDDKAPSINLSLNLEYSFDYTRFNEPSLESTAKVTLGNFFGFVRQSFDVISNKDYLVFIGQYLQKIDMSNS